MAITAGNWSSATDPFILALAHAYTGTLGDLSNNRIIIYDTEGFISGVTTDRDIQEIYWSKDSDKEITWFANAMETVGLGPHQTPHELGKYQERVGGSLISFNPTDYIEDDTKDARVYTTGKSSGAVQYSLFAYTAFSWVKKDPAQILFSWIAHHVDSLFTLKDHLNQTSFQDASDYYDLNPIELTLWREAGLSISNQIKKVIDHTADFLVIRPADADGKLQMHISPRLSGLTIRDTAIDLDSKSVSDYISRPTDRYTIDRLDISYGAAFYFDQAGIPSNPEDYNFSRPLDLPGKNRTVLSQKVGTENENRSVTFDAPYHSTRGNLSNHIDIGYWKDDQDELEVDFADWSHLNFEAGDLVPVTGGRANYSDEMFLCTEKQLDMDTMKATARFIQMKQSAGKRPKYADQANLLLSIAPNSLGDYFDGTSTFPKEIFISDDPRNLDRLWDLSNNYAHVSEMTRGAPPAGNLWLYPDQIERWPALLNDATRGGDFPLVSSDMDGGPHTTAASNLTMYCVVNPLTVATSQKLFDQTHATESVAFYISSSGNVKYYDGNFHGTQASITGWQIIVFILDSTGSTIRRNGADLETGLAYTQKRLLSTADQGFLVAAVGDTAHLTGWFGEMHLFEGAHSGATVDEIEAHLAEKYAITI